MDATIKSLPLESECILEMMELILSDDLNDGVAFEIVGIKDIREEDAYGGFRISIIAIFEDIRIHLAVDLTSGDKITPSEINYQYNSVFEDKQIAILAYTIETIIAEKYHVIITRGIFNTRMKDLYDIYILISENRNKIDKYNLSLAIKNTFKKRDTPLIFDEIEELIEYMITNERLRSLWDNYQLNAPYSNSIEYKCLFSPLMIITDI